MAASSFSSFLSIEDFNEYKVKDGLFKLVQTETYNEHLLRKTIEDIGHGICCAIAIQLSIIGYGNKSFGKVKFEGLDVDIADFFEKNNIRSNLTINFKLCPSDLTPRRLIRFFRFIIADYLTKHNIQSYLFKKYCLNKTEQSKLFIFPGFEHMADPIIDSEKVKYLLETYEYLDSRSGTNIKSRIVSVLVARGFNKDSFN